MEEVIFTGYNYGRFQRDDGQYQDYCNIFVLQAFGGSDNQDYHFGGQKAMKYPCVSPEVFKDITPGARVQIALNTAKKVSYMAPAQK